MKENIIHPTAIIGKDVELGYGNIILPYTVIEGKVRIGNGNRIGPHVVIGCPATDTKHVDYGYDDPCVVIGNDNEIREFSLIEQPCYEERTIIGNEVFIMQGVHISHDVHIHDKAVLTNTSVLAGIVKVLEGANVAMACTINQYTVIGHYSIVASAAVFPVHSRQACVCEQVCGREIRFCGISERDRRLRIEKHHALLLGDKETCR